MKNKIFALIALMSLVNVSLASEIDMHSKVENVTLYHSGALVSRTCSNELKSGINELNFKNISSKILLNSIVVNNKEVTILNKSLIKKLTKEEFNQLLDKKEAMNKQLNLIESKYLESGFITKVEDLEKMTAFYSDKMTKIKKDLREIEKRIEEARKLDNIELLNENAGILQLIVSIDGNLSEPLNFQYVCGGIGWNPAYEINVESSAKHEIKIKYLAKIMSQTGEDWDNVAIHLSSSFPLESPNDLPKPKYPWVLDGGSNAYYKNASDINMAQQKSEQLQINKLEGVEYHEISVPSYLKVRNLKEKYTIKSNSTVFTFPIQTLFLPADFYYYGYPGLDPEVYLVAQVTGWDTLGFIDGIANISYGGNTIGKSVVNFSEAKDTLLLPVGKDNSVFLKRSEIADQKYFKITNIGKRRLTTYAYKFELKNNNPFPIQFELLEQIPISQTKSAEVEILQHSGGNLNKESGEVSWSLFLKPGQVAEKTLLYSVEMEANFGTAKNPAKREFKTIASPSF